MLLTTQISAILMLLSAFGVDPITLGNVQLILQGQTITSSSMQPMNTTPQPPAPAPTPMAAGAPVPASQARIEIISPTKLNGYIANDYKLNPNGSLAEGSVSPDASNSVVIKVLVYDDAGNINGTENVSVTVDGNTKVLNGTGDVATIYKGTNRLVVPAYVYNYEFRTAGDHTITFTTGTGLSQSITLTAVASE